MQGKINMTLDQKLQLVIEAKNGRHSLRLSRPARLNVFPGSFVDGATSLTAIQKEPGTQPWDGELRRGDLITVALNQWSLVQVIEVVE